MTVLRKRRLESFANWSMMIALFFNPFGFDLVQYFFMNITGSLWYANAVMYCIAALFFGASIFWRIKLKRAT